MISLRDCSTSSLIFMRPSCLRLKSSTISPLERQIHIRLLEILDVSSMFFGLIVEPKVRRYSSTFTLLRALKTISWSLDGEVDIVGCWGLLATLVYECWDQGGSLGKTCCWGIVECWVWVELKVHVQIKVNDYCRW